MKKLVILSLACLALYGFLLHKSLASPAYPPVYDVKSAPGSNCRAYFCDWFPPASSKYYYEVTELFGGAIDGSVLVTGPYPGATHRCDYTCPIVRDRPGDPNGIAVAWIDIALPQYGNTPLPDPNRKATCELVQTSALYTTQTSNGSLQTYTTVKGPSAGWLAEKSATYRGTLTPGAVPTTAPPPYTGTIAGYTYGSAAIHCSMPPDAIISSYGWLESGGESTDW